MPLQPHRSWCVSFTPCFPGEQRELIFIKGFGAKRFPLRPKHGKNLACFCKSIKRTDSLISSGWSSSELTKLCYSLSWFFETSSLFDFVSLPKVRVHFNVFLKQASVDTECTSGIPQTEGTVSFCPIISLAFYFLAFWSFLVQQPELLLLHK